MPPRAAAARPLGTLAAATALGRLRDHREDHSAGDDVPATSEMPAQTSWRPAPSRCSPRPRPAASQRPPRRPARYPGAGGSPPPVPSPPHGSPRPATGSTKPAAAGHAGARAAARAARRTRRALRQPGAGPPAAEVPGRSTAEQAPGRHPDSDRAGQPHHPPVQPDPPSHQRPQAQQRGQVERIRSDHYPRPDARLTMRQCRDRRGNLRSVGSQRRHHPQQRLRQPGALAQPLKPRDQQPAAAQAHRHAEHEQHQPAAKPSRPS